MDRNVHHFLKTGWVRVAVFASCLFSSSLAAAATLPSGFAEIQVATGLDPSAMEFSPDGRLFILEKPGRVRILKNDVLLPVPFVTVAADNHNERGLSGIAFDPDFATNGHVFLYYTVLNGVPGASTHNRVIRVTADSANPDRALAGSQTTVLDLDTIQPENAIHMGGGMFFRDGKLHIGTGEAGVGGRSQSMTSLMGKILRIHSDGSIPADNPFYQTASGKFRAIYALGLRNPYSFDVQAGDGMVYLNDVGGHSGSYEEINSLAAGANYGWPENEGVVSAGQSAYQSPIHAYPPGGHQSGHAICGGVFYDPPATGQGRFPAGFTGLYFFGDYVNRWIKTYNPATSTVADFSSNHHRPLSFRLNSTGALYLLTRGNENDGSVSNNTSSNVGMVWKVVHTASDSPSISAVPASAQVSVGEPVSFSVSYSGSAPYQVQWQRNGADIPGESQVTSSTTASYTLSPAALADHGAEFRCVITNSGGSITSGAAVLSVTSRQPPVVEISSPAAGMTYSGGQVIHFSGFANDPEDGALSAAALSWRVDFQHDTHTHPVMPPLAGVEQGSFTISNLDHGSNVWYRIYLTATNSAGLSRTVYREIFPKFVTLTLASEPTGLRVKLDGRTHVTPHVYQGIAGMVRTLEAIDPQAARGSIHAFDSWSHGQAGSHSWVTPEVDATVTAWFNEESGGGITRDYWLDVPGSQVDQLVAHAAFPSTPAGTEIVSGFSGAADWADDYGARLRGLVIPPATGSHVFHLSGMGESELWLSPTNEASASVRIVRAVGESPLGFEAFDYPEGAIAGKGAAAGDWSTAWSGSGAVITGNPGYVDSQNAALPGEGLHLELNQQMAFRNRSASFGSGRLWISFIGKAPNPGSGYAGVSLFDNDSERLFLGQRWQSSFWGMERSYGLTADSQASSGSSAFLVYRIDFGAGSGGSANVHLWVNPTLGLAGEPTLATRSAQLINVPAFQFNRLRAAAGDTNGSFSLDELRLGTTYTQVAPSAVEGMKAESSPVILEGGKAYYLEVLHKAGVGHDHLSVRWSGPGFSNAAIGGAQVAPLHTPPDVKTYRGWRQSHFRGAQAVETRSGFTADFNGNGVPNGIEYALGIHPAAGASMGLPTLAGRNGFLEFTYRKDIDLGGIAYQVESSTDLVSWHPDEPVERQVAAEGTVRWMEARVPVAPGEPKFIRLQVREAGEP